MFSFKTFSGRWVAVLGLGPGGHAVVRALEASGANILAWDASSIRRDEIDFPCQPPRQWPMDRLSAVVLGDGGRGGLSRGVVERAEEADVPVFTELEFFSHALNQSGLRDEVKLIAVTGGAGKSVTVSIIAHVLNDLGWDVSVGGDIGRPLMDLEPPSPNRVYVLELPLRKLAGLSSLSIDVSVTLNVPRSRSKAEIQLATRALMKMHRKQRPGDTAIVGVDDMVGQELCTALRTGTNKLSDVGTVIPVSGEAALSHGIFVLDGAAYAIRCRKAEALGDFSRGPGFLGAHFNQDSAAAIAACLSIGIPAPMIIKSLHHYQGLPGRFECLGAVGNVVFVDDSYASSGDAAEHAINACPNVFWIGGNAETHAAIGEGADGVNGAYLFKPDYHGAGMREAFARAFEDASACASKDPESAPVVLFSPGVTASAGGFGHDDFRHLFDEQLTGARAHA